MAGVWAGLSLYFFERSRSWLPPKTSSLLPLHPRRPMKLCPPTYRTPCSTPSCRTLRDLMDACGDNKHEKVDVLITALIDRGIDTGPRIIDAAKRLDFDGGTCGDTPEQRYRPPMEPYQGRHLPQLDIAPISRPRCGNLLDAGGAGRAADRLQFERRVALNDRTLHLDVDRLVV